MKLSFAMLVFFMFACLFLTSGCQDQFRPAILQDYRSWNTTYSCKIQIQTEPPGAMIYINDMYKGESPLNETLNVPDTKITQNGEYPAVQRYSFDLGHFLNWLGYVDGWVSKGSSRSGPTVWKGNLSGNFAGGWRIKAYKDGYEPFEFFLTKQMLKQFDNAVNSLEIEPGDKLQNYFSSSESEYCLFALKPDVTPSSPPPQQISYYQQSANDQTDILKEARQEYETALEAYNIALKEYDDTKILVNTPGYYPHPALGVLVEAGKPKLLADKERALEIARERLERAKAKLNHAEM
jgi:hypothetical protein